MVSGVTLRGSFREIGVAFTAGVGAGILTGLASRVAMKISSLADPSELIRVTSNGNVVGDLTVEGTLGLVIFAGIGPGVLAGGLYGAVRPWLARFGRWDGLAFGMALLLMSGSAVIEPSNPDFRRFGPPILNVLLFGVLFLVLGLALAALWRAVGRWPARLLDLLAVPGTVVIGAAMLAIGSAAVLTLSDGSGERLGDTALGLILIVVTTVIALGLRRFGVISRASIVAFAVPVLVGSVTTIRAVALILAR